jgi:DNA-binding transcriptional LysR family regulator
MDLRRIRHFHVLAETLNFSRAAERLHIAQPALSVSIQKLEAEIGTRLFNRTSTGVTLTATGEAILIEARRVLYHGEQLQRLARDTSEGTTGPLRIGFVGSAIYGVLPTLVPAFRAEYPRVELVLKESTSSQIMEAIADERLDIGIVRAPLLRPTQASWLPVERDHFVLAVPRDHMLAARAEVSVQELAHEAFIMYAAPEAPGLHGSAMAICQAAGFVPTVAQEAVQISTVLALVETGLGVALVPGVMRGQRQAGVAYLGLSPHSEICQTNLVLAWQEGQESPAASRFVALARRAAGE